MPDYDTFVVVEPRTYNPHIYHYFPVETKELEEGLTVLEVTPEYLKVKCE